MAYLKDELKNIVNNIVLGLVNINEKHNQIGDFYRLTRLENWLALLDI